MFNSISSAFILLFLIRASPTEGKNDQLIIFRRTGLCISPAGGSRQVSKEHIEDGTALTTIDCKEAAAWDISNESGSFTLTETLYAMDAGTPAGNNGQLKVWTSYPGAAAQTWYFTNDGQIALAGGDQCIDVGDNGGLQTYACSHGNPNQVWSAKNKHDGYGLDLGPPVDGFLSNVPRGNVTDDDGGRRGRRIHPYNRDDLCLTTQGGEASVGTSVQVTYCFGRDDPFAQFQLWQMSTVTGVIRLAAYPGLCIDAGENPSNNGEVKVWSCDESLPQQQWSPIVDQNIVKTVNTHSRPIEQPNYPNQGVLQTYKCYPDNQQQNFHFIA